MLNLKTLPKEFLTLYVATFQTIYKDTNDDELARKSAWQNILNQYRKVEDKWIKKEEKSSFEMYITKSSIDNTGKMTFSMSASDIIPDSFGERMSLQLYKSFIERVDGNEYVSIAHYPEFEDNSGVLGYVTNVYVDGTVLKGRGYFLETPEGIAAYNAIRKDRRDNIPFTERVRVSIGFYDYAHTHDEKTVWKYELNPVCEDCYQGKTQGKMYLDGKLCHFALTRRPSLKSTSIEI